MWRLTSAVLVIVAAATSCGGRTVVVTPREPLTPAAMAQLRVDPGRTPRDLFWGAGGRAYAPPPDVVYRQQGRDDAGFSVSYDVVDPRGREWSAKIGPEAQTEVVVSRILWGLGYHQPPVYYLPSWRVRAGDGEARLESEARFRPKLPAFERLDEPWSWADNPFSGTSELKTLLVVLLMLNSTDLKDTNNSIYRVGGLTPVRGMGVRHTGVGPPFRYVVRDLGAALGETGKLHPRRNWLQGFEREAFITAVEGPRIDVAYDGRHRDLLAMVGPEDVRRGARALARLTDAQWRDAFRAGNYAPSHAGRFIRRIEDKIADGLALRVDRRLRKE